MVKHQISSILDEAIFNYEFQAHSNEVGKAIKIWVVRNLRT